MNPVDLLKQPWFAVSPSPWSLAFYVIFGLIGARQLLRAGAKYKRWPWLMAFIDALFLLGMIVFIQDTIWLVCNTAKWIIPLYSDTANFWNYYVRFAQNILGFLFLTLLSYGNLRLRVASFNRKTLAYLLIIACFTCAVFILAPSQAYTDWVFAVSYGFSDQVILEAFLISHVGYKALIALAFLSLFSRPGNKIETRLKPEIEDNSIELLKDK